MKQGCPNIYCLYYHQTNFQVKDGSYFRKDDSRKIQRYKCTYCFKKYSKATDTLEYRQKKRRYNQIIRNELSSGVSLRRCAYNLSLNRVTIARKLEYLAKKARLSQAEFLSSIQEHSLRYIQFDDLITSIHSKLKPLAISVIIDAKQRLILAAKVSVIPAFGHLAKISRNKYGRRKNEHPKNLDFLLSFVKPLIANQAQISTDQHKLYPELVKKHFPSATHLTYKGQRASVVGFGELKTKQYDPLFMINHTLAMLRANINRLFRRTWCTTKSVPQLQNHLDIFIDYFNCMVLEKLIS